MDPQVELHDQPPAKHQLFSDLIPTDFWEYEQTQAHEPHMFSEITLES